MKRKIDLWECQTTREQITELRIIISFSWSDLVLPNISKHGQ